MTTSGRLSTLGETWHTGFQLTTLAPQSCSVPDGFGWLHAGLPPQQGNISSYRPLVELDRLWLQGYKAAAVQQPALPKR